MAGGPFKNAMATIGAGGLLVLVYVGFHTTKFQIAAWEVRHFPVLADVTVCEGEMDRRSGQCLGSVVTYKGFEQTAAFCDGQDAIVAGVMSKVRRDAVYAGGDQFMYFGDPDGRFRRAFWKPLDQPSNVPRNRPAGVQDWGQWRLYDGCASQYRQWFSTVEHWPWHNLYPLSTTIGPFPLPRPR
ncbi:hypothetical protein [Aurantimonas phage AmM-1]|uniref:hypothetical protein n=1 Tax=Aurantimonas phage AmM-1 TaxID=1503929 RepID=UPI00054087A0|nr:hypothetical protein ACQ23_gp32 [Aurantimonas phage AmM-1]BAP94489.1 hypothetical protein [Aurantimonas phage AmM-1]